MEGMRLQILLLYVMLIVLYDTVPSRCVHFGHLNFGEKSTMKAISSRNGSSEMIFNFYLGLSVINFECTKYSLSGIW